MNGHGVGMTKLIQWLRAPFTRTIADVGLIDFTGITAMLDMLKDEEGITPGHP